MNSADNDINITLSDLIGRQSVRATFRLPQQVIDLLSVISVQLGIKQKSLFDQLIQDPKILRQVAQEAQSYDVGANHRRQKTFVMSRCSLLVLNKIAEQENIHRDLLVEISIQRLLPIINTELKKHRKRKELLKEMADYLSCGSQLLEKSERMLGKDDQVYEMLKEQVDMARKNLSVAEDLVEKGMIMEKL